VSEQILNCPASVGNRENELRPNLDRLTVGVDLGSRREKYGHTALLRQVKGVGPITALA